MEVKLEKRYPIAVSAEQAWAVLRDVRSVAGCMPGAAITEQIDETHYKGTVKLKVGPATAQFNGDIEVLGLDAAARRMHLHGKGADKGGSSAAMELTAVIEAGEKPEECVLFGTSAVTVSGKFAQFGGRMMGQVSDLMLGQFVDNFRAAASALPVAEGGAAAPPARPAGELNALAILWALIKGWFARLFGKRESHG
jgi:carbon monoxide dehydrogenase subunit G